MSKNTAFRSFESSILPTNYHSTTPAIRPRVRTRNLAALITAFLPCLLLCPAPAQQAGGAGTTNPVKSSTIAADYGKLPLSFEANQGQTAPQVRFLSHGNGYSLFLTDSAAVLTLNKGDGDPSGKRTGFGMLPRTASGMKAAAARPGKTDVLRMELAGASKGLRVTGDGQLPGKANYLVGKDPAKWYSNVPTYSKVKYAGVYPGVDLVYYGNQTQLEYDFVVAPHADAKPIRLHFAGASRLKLDNDGNLRVIAKDGEIAFHKPVVYQQIDGQRREVDGQFKLLAENSVSFALGDYQRDKTLIIDPTLVYSTYLDGGYGTFVSGIAVDLNGDAYVTGETLSNNFPVTPGAFQTAFNGTFDGFVIKLNPEGTTPIYSTYLGGSGGAGASSIAVDAAGDAFVTGRAQQNFPVTPGALQVTGSGGAFVTKLNPSGSALIYSTYLGGANGGNSIAVDSAGDAYVIGTIGAQLLPVTPGAFQTRMFGSSSAFVSKLNPTGSALIYSTYLSGTGADVGNAIAVDPAGDAYLTGTATSTDFPVTSGAFQATNNAAANGRYNAFVTKLNPTGTGLLFSTYLGGSSGPGNEFGPPTFGEEFGDYGNAITFDSQGNAYVAGYTNSPDFPVTSGAFQTQPVSNENGNGFITKLNPSGSSLVFSTYLHGSGGAYAYAIALDASGDIYTAGGTYSEDFPVTSDAFQSVSNSDMYQGHSAFLTKLNPTGSALLYSTYFGSYDEVTAIAKDTIGDLYLAGDSGPFGPIAVVPLTPGAFETSGTGFAFKFGFAPVDFSQPGISFGNVLVGTKSNSISITASNYTNAPTGQLSGSNLGQFHITVGTCGSSSDGAMLAAGASCTFQVWFAPTQVGPVTGSLTISTVNGPVTFIMTGTGVALNRK